MSDLPPETPASTGTQGTVGEHPAHAVLDEIESGLRVTTAIPSAFETWLKARIAALRALL